MKFEGIGIVASSQCPIVFLKDTFNKRKVPIPISHEQAHNICNELNEYPSKSISSHELMLTLLKAANIYIDRIIINTTEDDLLEATIKINCKEVKIAEKLNKEVKSSIIDAILLAIKSDISLWLSENILADKSIAFNEEDDRQESLHFKQFIDTIKPVDLFKSQNNH